MNRKRILVLVMALMLVASGALQAQDEGRTLVIAHAEATDSLDPARGFTQTTGVVNKATYDTLVTFPDDTAGEILPLLASEWAISEDGLTYTFTLNDVAVFSNGDDVNSDDVIFSINRLKHVLGSPSFLAANISSVSSTDENTVVFTLAANDPSFLSKLANSAFSIVNADVVIEQGGSEAEDAAEIDGAEAYLNDTSAGSGPYVLDRWEQGVETILVRNENYWGDAPYFERVIIQNIPEAASQKAAVEAGDADMALDLTSDQAAALEGVEGVSVVEVPANIVHFILMNRDPACGATADPLVERAIRLALDYEGYVALWGGITPAAPTGVALYTGYGSENATVRDLDAARALLAEAGYADGLELTLEYPTFSFQGVNMDTNAQKIQADLAEVGITVALSPGELQVSLEAYRAGDQCLGYWFWGPDILDPIDSLSFVAGGKVAAERANWTRDNADQTILDLYDRAAVETDPAGRVEVYTQIYDYLQESGPWAPFIQPSVQTALSSDIQGYVWHPQWLLDVAILSRAE